MNATGSAPVTTARVMIVDDEECIRHTVYELLSSVGIDVVAAAGADDCLDYLRNGFRGVILMDVMMPDRNGWDTIREIRKSGFLDGNIISMLTAMDVPDQQMEGLQEIIVDYITKPFEPTVLIASVQKYLGYLGQIQAGN